METPLFWMLTGLSLVSQVSTSESNILRVSHVAAIMGSFGRGFGSFERGFKYEHVGFTSAAYTLFQSSIPGQVLQSAYVKEREECKWQLECVPHGPIFYVAKTGA